VVDDFIIPFDFALIDQSRERSDGERLAGRAGGEDCVGSDWLFRADFAYAPPVR